MKESAVYRFQISALVPEILKVVLRPKEQFLFFFGFQNYVNYTLIDPSIKFWFLKDTCLF